MKKINLLSLNDAFEKFNTELFRKYLAFYRLDPKLQELNDIKSLIFNFKEAKAKSYNFDGFYLNYSIPQIPKEFDLLRFGDNWIINLELKSQERIDDIQKQLVRNKYYLSFLGVDTYCYCYVSSTTNLFLLDLNNKLVKVQFSGLIDNLSNQVISNIKDINDLFDPSNYLVSPFNSTKQFIANHYFLTTRQEEIKQEVFNLLSNKSAEFISICGKAGTGKTLLTFDIAKEWINNNKKVLIIHCGLLNNGHAKLKEHYGWEIKSMADLRSSSYDVSAYEIVIIDETQRVWPQQLKNVIDSIKSSNGKCIFSYDMLQWLRKWESDNDIQELINNVAKPSEFKLTEKIRTNKEIAFFIKALFNKNKRYKREESSNVEVYYFNEHKDALRFCKSLGRDDWKLINFTPSNRQNLPYDGYNVPNEDSVHRVIGQEFDKVVAIIDKHFGYQDGKLTIKNYPSIPYYHPPKMLFQILTRTRKKLCIIIIQNEEMLERCIDILGPINLIKR